MYNKSEQFKFKLEKKYWDLEKCRESQKKDETLRHKSFVYMYQTMCIISFAKKKFCSVYVCAFVQHTQWTKIKNLVRKNIHKNIVSYAFNFADLITFLHFSLLCNMKVFKNLVKCSKGQLISKCLFGVFTFFQKTNENQSSNVRSVRLFVFLKKHRLEK